MLSIRALNSKHLAEFFFTVLDKVFLLFGGFVVLQLLAERMSRESFGAYSLGISIYTIVSMLPFTAFDHAITRYWSTYQVEGAWCDAMAAVVRAFLVLFAFYALCVIAVAVSGVVLLAGLETSLHWIFAFAILEVARISLLNIENARRERAMVAWSNGFIYLSRCLIVLALDQTEMLTLGSLFGCFALLSVLNVMWLLAANRVWFATVLSASWASSREILAPIGRFALPMIIWGPFVWAQNMANRWLLGSIHGEGLVADFVAVNAVATLIPTATFGVIWALMTPIIYQRENAQAGATRSINRTVQPLFGTVLLFGFLVCLFFDDLIFDIIFTRYAESSWMLPWLYMPAAAIQWGAYGASELYAGMKTRLLILPNVLPGLAAFVLGAALISAMNPLWGAVANTITTGFLYLVLTMLAISRHRESMK